MIGFHSPFQNFIGFLIVVVLFNMASGAQCIMISTIAPTVAIGNFFAIILILANALFSGMLLNKAYAPSYITWCPYLSIWNYAFEALMISEVFMFVFAWLS